MTDFHALIDSYQNCACGQAHTCAIRDIEIGSGLVSEVGEILNVCDTIAWQAEDEQGNTYLAVFNLGNLPAKREITLDKLGLSGEYTVHDLWGDQPDAVVSSGIVCSIDTHGAVLFKLTTKS